MLKLVTIISKFWLVFTALTLFACSSIPDDEREAIRRQIDKDATHTLATLIEQDPQIKQQVESSSGYVLTNSYNVKVPLFGAGGGSAVLYNQDKATQTYFDLENYDVGIGFGAVKEQTLSIFESQEALEKMKDRNWDWHVNSELSIKKSEQISYSRVEIEGIDIPIYRVSENDGSLSTSARFKTLSINDELTDTAISQVSLPIKDYKTVGEQKEGAPREWGRVLPFLGQEVINEGYDLPLPFGISITNTNVFQHLNIHNLEVGFNGSDKVAMEFVEFDENSTESNSPQLTLDAWLFPFMNVYGSVGKIAGDATVHFGFNGDTLLDQLGVDCSNGGGIGGRPPAICGKLEGNDSEKVRVDVEFEGRSYTVGMVLAGGWESYFVAIPMSYTYADMKSSNTKGAVFSAMPRAGKVFPLSCNKSFSLYVGASYIDSQLVISGTHEFANAPNVDYQIEQSNPEKWAGLFGGSFNIDKHWSVVLEYSGYSNSREQWLGSIKYRF